MNPPTPLSPLTSKKLVGTDIVAWVCRPCRTADELERLFVQEKSSYAGLRSPNPIVPYESVVLASKRWPHVRAMLGEAGEDARRVALANWDRRSNRAALYASDLVAAHPAFDPGPHMRRLAQTWSSAGWFFTHHHPSFLFELVNGLEPVEHWVNGQLSSLKAALCDHTIVPSGQYRHAVDVLLELATENIREPHDLAWMKQRAANVTHDSWSNMRDWVSAHLESCCLSPRTRPSPQTIMESIRFAANIKERLELPHLPHLFERAHGSAEVL